MALLGLSHIADQFLKYGYKVRSTTRSPEKNAWIGTLFNNKYGPGNFGLVAVPDMGAQGAFVQAVKGVSAVVHTAIIFSLCCLSLPTLLDHRGLLQ